MSNRPTDYRPRIVEAAAEPAKPAPQEEMRDTIVKSGLTGVAATMLAVTIFSPAGLGGMIGTSLASGAAADPNAASADSVYANLPAYPAPLTDSELSDIRGQLARTTASLEITRAATEARIEHIRSISLREGAVSYTPMPQQTAQIGGGLRLSLSEPPMAAPAPLVADAQPVPVSYEGGGGEDLTPYRGSHLEFAELMFAHENF
jgi:hypothetical protein